MKLKTQNDALYPCQPPVTDNGEAMKSCSALPRAISYIPYGEIFVEQQSSGWQSPYLFNSKELDEETGLYYYGARYLDPTHAMWLSVDPLWEKYAGMSPYGYCAGNPVRLVDVDGRTIEDESKEEWNSYKQDLNNKITSLNADENPDKERISLLSESLKTMDEMETSSQIYTIKHVSESENFGSVTLDPNNLKINISIRKGNVSGFVHEITHCGQFEKGDLAFIQTDGRTLLQDVQDEISAYKAQMAYDPNYLSLFSTTPHKISDINVDFLEGLCYGNNNLGMEPISINSSKFDLIKSYYSKMSIVEPLIQSNFNTAKDIPNIYYKK